MTRDRFQIDPLVQIAELQTKPAAPGILIEIVSYLREIGDDSENWSLRIEWLNSLLYQVLMIMTGRPSLWSRWT
jgi:hypothetical protein